MGRFAARTVAGLWALVLTGAPVWAEVPRGQAEALARAFHVPEGLEISAQTGLEQARDLRSELMPELPEATWEAEIAPLYLPEALFSTYLDEFAKALSPEDVARFTTLSQDGFYQSLITLELAASRAFLAPDAVDAAYLQLDAAGLGMMPQLAERKAEAEAHSAAIALDQDYVMAWLNEDLAEQRGLWDGGFFAGYDVSEAEVLSSVAQSAEDMPDQARDWISVFFLTAYRSLDAESFRKALELQRTPEALGLADLGWQASNAAFEKAAYETGLRLGRHAGGAPI